MGGPLQPGLPLSGERGLSRDLFFKRIEGFLIGEECLEESSEETNNIRTKNEKKKQYIKKEFLESQDL